MESRVALVVWLRENEMNTAERAQHSRHAQAKTKEGHGDTPPSKQQGNKEQGSAKVEGARKGRAQRKWKGERGKGRANAGLRTRHDARRTTPNAIRHDSAPRPLAAAGAT